MNPRRLSIALLGVAALALLLAALRWRRAPAFENTGEGGAPRAVAAAHVLSSDSVSVAAGDIAANDPFRLSNEPASVRYDMHADGATIAAAPPILPSPAVQRPSLVLRAIIGGPPWQAVIDGLPGQPPGTIVSAGTEVEHLRVASITRDSVVIMGADTTWTLRFNTGP